MGPRLSRLTEEMTRVSTIGLLTLTKIMTATIPLTKEMALLMHFPMMERNGMTLIAMDMETILTLRLHPTLALTNLGHRHKIDSDAQIVMVMDGQTMGIGRQMMLSNGKILMATATAMSTTSRSLTPSSTSTNEAMHSQTTRPNGMIRTAMDGVIITSTNHGMNLGNRPGQEKLSLVLQKLTNSL